MVKLQVKAGGRIRINCPVRLALAWLAVHPLQKASEGGSTMAVTGFFFGVQLGEGLVNCGKEEQWIVSKSIPASGRVQNDALGGAAEGLQGLAVAGCGQHADETRGAILFWNAL